MKFNQDESRAASANFYLIWRQRMFYQFAHNASITPKQNKVHKPEFSCCHLISFKKKRFISILKVTIFKSKFYPYVWRALRTECCSNIFLLLHQLSPQSQWQSSCQVCCDYLTGDYEQTWAYIQWKLQDVNEVGVLEKVIHIFLSTLLSIIALLSLKIPYLFTH